LPAPLAFAPVGRLVVIEGLDGAGKRTLAEGLAAALTAQGATVARMAFPRYSTDVHADLAREALYGRRAHRWSTGETPSGRRWHPAR